MRPARRSVRPRAPEWRRGGCIVATGLSLVACGPIVDPTTPVDPCTEPPSPLSLGSPVSGVLDAETDCFDRDGRLGDRYQLRLDEPTLFALSLSTEGYLPFVPTYLEADQLSGWASDSANTLSREHLFPAGSYVVRASSLGKASTPAGAPQGPYTLLATKVTAPPQEGCGRETSITYGSVAGGRITVSDCTRAPGDEPDRPRLADGYAAILAAGRDMTALATADFPFRLLHFADGVPAGASGWLPAGAEASVIATGKGFHDFYVLSEAGSVGGYLVRFLEVTRPSVGGSRRVAVRD